MFLRPGVLCQCGSKRFTPPFAAVGMTSLAAENSTVVSRTAP